MARTVAEGFDVLLGRFPASQAVAEKTARHRDTLHDCLSSRFPMTKFVAAGSVGHGTDVPGFSDVDYFMVMDEDDWPNNSALALRKVKAVLANRFWSTNGIRVSSPVVLVPFGRTSTERFEITPAFYDGEADDHETFWIPDRQTGWMLAAPRAHNSYVTEVNQRLNSRAKPVIRLVKLWNGLAAAGLRSIYLELRIAKRLSTADGVTYSAEVWRTFSELRSNGLRAMQDPLRISGLIEACSETRKDQALSRIETAYIRADKALEAEAGGNPRRAFEWWNKVFGGNFPAYR